MTFYGNSPLTDSEPASGCAKSRGSEAISGHEVRPRWLTSGRRAGRLAHANTATHFYKNLAIAGRLFDVMVYGEPEGQTWSILTAISPGTN